MPAQNIVSNSRRGTEETRKSLEKGEVDAMRPGGMREAMDVQLAYESCFHQITDAIRVRIIVTFFHKRGWRKL